MHSLATHYLGMRNRYPEDDLLVVFDIDGTILDMRHMVCRVLLDFDREHDTFLFHGLRAEDVTTHENHVERLLGELEIAPEERGRVLRWYLERRWSRESVLAAHRPHQGVLDIIRWFQLQPGTRIGLNPGRPESLREDTIKSLNALGREYRVEFPGERLDSWDHEVNFYNVPDLESFLQAAPLLPRSLTSDFNFPEWNYFGRGSGRDNVYHSYAQAGAAATRSAA